MREPMIPRPMKPTLTAARVLGSPRPEKIAPWLTRAWESTSAGRSPISSRSSTGTWSTAKVPSTPDDQSEGVDRGAVEAAGVERGRRRGLRARHDRGHQRAARAARRAHGARHDRGLPRRARDRPPEPRRSLYDLTRDRPPPLVPRELRFAVRERMGPDGVIDAARRGEPGRAPSAALRDADVEAVAVCLLFSFLPPGARAARRRGAARRACRTSHVSLSQRGRCPSSASTSASRRRSPTPTCRPLLAAYLRPARRARRGAGAARAARHAVLGRRRRRATPRPSTPRACVLSGPAGGVVGAALVAARGERLRRRAHLRHGRHEHRRRAVARRRGARRRPSAVVAGVPMQLPMVDVHTVERRRRLDRLGATPAARCASGPRSAGADPGPAVLRPRRRRSRR